MRSDRYRHTQIGWVMVLVLGGAALVSLGFSVHAGVAGRVFITQVVVMIALAMLFGSLHVDVDSARVRLRFGVGLIRKTIDRASIRSVSVVKSSAASGWGIRSIRRGWMWNVSGLQAVELELDDGRVFRIGTDDPDGLRAALAPGGAPPTAIALGRRR